ncbi:glycoside hydrolase family 43 protein [Actinospica durhamensis]|uniref:Glycoside hydrolase family 43 protein n=1 Tax=Actinospica durhamensis TaxID=1508375 RepID=A0A941IN75_9ACTN|nr:glycoside hydrolase family 43 protein [Actinospica durhamensis]MBR7831732.1 glycoside hydrolase family 43 protein [Actinospica durhamensis]
MREPMLVMSYFTESDEALHLALSHDGGHRFEPVDAGRPVLRGSVGTGALRDPFLGVGPDGLIHLLATDGWSSPSIVHAVSADLRSWSPQRLLPVMASVPGAHNAWAPEFFHDHTTGRYHLIWSSVVDAATPAESRDWQNIGQDHRIWSCATEDFSTFSAPEVFFDPGHPVIDATVVHDGERFLMAYKDERGINDPATSHKHILVTSFERPGGPYAPPRGPVGPSATEGPSLFRRDDGWIMLFDQYLEGRYGAARSTDGSRWEPAKVELPAGMRHASVFTMPG